MLHISTVAALKLLSLHASEVTTLCYGTSEICLLLFFNALSSIYWKLKTKLLLLLLLLFY